eukprot:jgi/Mesvir1/6815/Mv09005-RA.1
MGSLGKKSLSDDGFILRMLLNHGSRFSPVLENPEKYRFQVLLSEVTPPGGHGPGSNRPSLVRHAFRVDHEYFYPASTVKLCAAIAALQKLTQLSKTYGVPLTASTPLALYPLFASPSLSLDKSSAAEDDVERELTKTSMTVADEVRKIFLVSDNAAFNRLYDFVGHKTLNASMWAAGLTSTRLRSRVSVVCSEEESKLTPAVEIAAPYFRASLPPRRSDLHLGDSSGLPGITVGCGFVAPDDCLVDHPLDFSQKNRISLLDLQDALVQLFVPEAWHGGGVGIRPGFGLTSEHLALLKEAMGAYPRHSTNPTYATKDYPDDYGKFFLPGVRRVRDERAIRIYNKIGRAYGFTIDNSYIVDAETGRGFFLSAVLYTNANGILNDDKYEYESLADGFLADLGEVAARTVWQIPPSEYLYQQPALKWEEETPEAEMGPTETQGGGTVGQMGAAGSINVAVSTGDGACQLPNGHGVGHGSTADSVASGSVPATDGMPATQPLTAGAIPLVASASLSLRAGGAVASLRSGGKTPRRSPAWQVESAAEVAVAAAEVAAAATLAAAEALAAVAEGMMAQEGTGNSSVQGRHGGALLTGGPGGTPASPSFVRMDLGTTRPDGLPLATCAQSHSIDQAGHLAVRVSGGDMRTGAVAMPLRVAARAEDTSRLAARLAQELSQLAAYLSPAASAELQAAQGGLAGRETTTPSTDASTRLFESVSALSDCDSRANVVTGLNGMDVSVSQAPSVESSRPVVAKSDRATSEAGPRIVSCHQFWATA